MVLALPSCFAGRLEAAERAMLARIGFGLRPSSDGGAKAALQAAEVSRDVSESDRKTVACAENDVGHLGDDFLNLFQRMAIKTELQRVFGSRMAGELGIEDLIGPVAQRGGPINPFEKVSNPMPPIRNEHGLINVL